MIMHKECNAVWQHMYSIQTTRRKCNNIPKPHMSNAPWPHSRQLFSKISSVGTLRSSSNEHLFAMSCLSENHWIWQSYALKWIFMYFALTPAADLPLHSVHLYCMNIAVRSIYTAWTLLYVPCILHEHCCTFHLYCMNTAVRSVYTT